MSLAAESPSASSLSSGSSDDFASILESELEVAISDTSPLDGEEDEIEDADTEVEEEDFEEQRFKKRKISEENDELEGTTVELSDTDENAICPPHPGFIRGMCVRCGQSEEEDGSAIAFGYIHPDLRLGASEIKRLREADRKDLLRKKKLVLILDLDHTLINSTLLEHATDYEKYLLGQADSTRDDPDQTLFRLDNMPMLTKLRPFIRTFLKEASSLFDMYIYTMGDKAYAQKIVELLDPEKVYFPAKVISKLDCTTEHQKGLDVVLGNESMAVILDDTESVWQKHKENLITMERYHYFASSSSQHRTGRKSLSESMQDERESDGALATVLSVLKRTHEEFFDPTLETELSSRDARSILKRIRGEILEGCNILFSGICPLNSNPVEHPLWKLAEQLGAKCCTEVGPTITHLVAAGPKTEKAKWGLKNNKFLVSEKWIEAAYFRWSRQKEEDFIIITEEKKS